MTLHPTSFLNVNSSFKHLVLTLFISFFLVACGNGGQDGASNSVDHTDVLDQNELNDDLPSPDGASAVEGRIVKGLISNAVVSAYPIIFEDGSYQIDRDAEPVISRTDGDGYYRVRPGDRRDQQYYYLEMVSDEQTRMICDLHTGCVSKRSGDYVDFGESFELEPGLVLSNIAKARRGRIKNAPLTPLTHLAVKHTLSLPGGLSPENIEQGRKFIETAFALESNALDRVPYDLTALSKRWYLSHAPLRMAVLSAAFAPVIEQDDWDRFDSLALDEIFLLAHELSQYLSEQSLSDWHIGALNVIKQDTYELYESHAQQALKIISQPSSVTVLEGQKLTLTVEATASGEISYQWFKGAAEVPGATSSVLVLDPASLSDSGLYQVRVSTASDSINSLIALATVTALNEVEPLAITQPPQALSVNEGQEIQLGVSVSGGGAIAYQWYKDGAQIPGAVEANFVISRASLNDEGQYKVNVSNAETSIFSPYVPVTVSKVAEVEPLLITQQPEAVSVNEGSDIRLNVGASGSGPISYQWLKNGAVLTGATQAVLFIPNSRQSDNGLYSVSVSNAAETLSSVAALVEVVQAVAPVSISSQPQSVVALEGEQASLSVSASGGGSLSYQWQKGGSVIPGATSSTLLLSNLQQSDEGAYSVTISNAVSSEQSSFATVTVNPVIDPIEITRQPQTLSVVEGDGATFSVEASGGGYIAYQWRKNGAAINNAYGASYSLASSELADAGSYDVVLTNSVGSVTSSAAVLSVVAIIEPVEVTQQPQNITLTQGESAQMSVSAIGGGTLNYRWTLNGQVLSHANGPSLTLDAVQTSDSGSYRVTVSNEVSSVQSTAAVVTVLVPEPEPEPQSKDVMLSWEMPDSRMDGSILYPEDIYGYSIVYGSEANNLSESITITGANETSATLSLLPSSWYFRIATTDAERITGNYSDLLQVDIQ